MMQGDGRQWRYATFQCEGMKKEMGDFFSIYKEDWDDMRFFIQDRERSRCNLKFPEEK